MSLVTLANYKTALGISGTAEDAKLTQYSLEIDDRIKSYLGYSLEQANYTDEIYDGNGTNELYPRDIPVTAITTLQVFEGMNSDDTEDWETWRVADDDYTRLLIRKNGLVIFMDGNVFPKGNQNIKLTYTAGYTSVTLPQDIQGVCKELMILKYKGIDQRALGTPSISLGVGSSGSYTYELDEDKILKKIEHYKLIRV